MDIGVWSLCTWGYNIKSSVSGFPQEVQRNMKTWGNWRGLPCNEEGRSPKGQQHTLPWVGHVLMGIPCNRKFFLRTVPFLGVPSLDLLKETPFYKYVVLESLSVKCISEWISIIVFFLIQKQERRNEVVFIIFSSQWLLTHLWKPHTMEKRFAFPDRDN